jgi:hypothetical protein
MDLKEIGQEGPDWIHLVVYDREQRTGSCVHSSEPYGAINAAYFTSFRTFNFLITVLYGMSCYSTRFSINTHNQVWYKSIWI